MAAASTSRSSGRPGWASRSGSLPDAQSSVPDAMTCRRTWSGSASGCPARYSATAPVTWGVAMDVPLMTAVRTVFPVPGASDLMQVPGATMSTAVPKLL